MSNARTMECHAAQRQGARHAQEDAWCVARPPGWFLGAIFDGHGGEAAARRAAATLPEKVAKKMNHPTLSLTLPHRGGGKGEILRESFEATSAEIEPRAEDGTTALAVLIGSGQMTWANCGDCRLLLVTADGHQQLTREHRLDNPAELQRITASGRAVIRPPYLFVGPDGLMPTRSLGDRSFKAAGVIATPEIGRRLLEAGDRWLVLGTDGLWDALANDAVAQITAWHKTPKTIAETLADAALQSGGSDNVTVLVVALAQSPRQKITVKMSALP